MRNTRRSLVAVVVLLLAAGVASAQIPMGSYVIPVVAKVKGAAGTDWRTNLSISNISDFDVKVSAHFFKENQNNTFNGTFAKANVTIRKGETLLVTDVIGTWFPGAGTSTKGWVLLAETSPQICPEPEDPPVPKLVVNARVYNAANPATLYGQTVEALWSTINPTTFPSIITGVLSQGNAKPGSRTNVGVANISTAAFDVQIKLFRANGTLAGTAQRKVEALSLRQWRLDTDLALPVLDGKAGRLEVSIVNPNFDPCEDVDEPPLPECEDPCAPTCTPSEKWKMPDVKLFTAYASNVDNGSGDGENLLPVIDYIGYSDYIESYRDQHCPSSEGESVIQMFVHRYGLERVRPQPTFRKLPRVEK